MNPTTGTTRTTPARQATHQAHPAQATHQAHPAQAAHQARSAQATHQAHSGQGTHQAGSAPATRQARLAPATAHPAHSAQPTHPAHPPRPRPAARPRPASEATPARRQLNLATRHQLTATAGIPPGTITSRTRPGGPWQRLLPRVYLLQTGPPDQRQRALAAVLYAAEPGSDPLSGDTAALTGGAALALLGIREAPYTPADVLIRAPRRLAASPEVRPFPTTRWPRTITVSGIPSTRPVRAAADFAARTDEPADRIRSILAQVVQSGWCHPQDLHAELRAARLLTRPAIRAAAAELLAGVRSFAEAQARDTLTATDLPTPLWNARLHTPDGTFLASPDAYWPDEGVALEIDSAEYHYTRDSWHATLHRRLRLETHGILVVSATPSMMRDTPSEVIAALRTLLTLTTTRPTPPTALARGHVQLELPVPRQ
ncbi:hypothetical protein OG730_26250 [Streptomyces sp. NBC_01298]|uniref:hypothetical protein n=1 Tax=Streptomyces sp. NBC_01298 TaxID=2903817 RepID=UPI002E0EDE47|nr:hypothetical protein OG730_26250 [Streptomyces sp. NBC_01298]